MKKWKIASVLFLAAGTFIFTGRASAEEEHEPITIIDYNRDYRKLIELVHETYPEINLQIEGYKGRNASAYMKKQLETGRMPDIYCTSQNWDGELQKEHLIDLSKYAVSERYNQVRLNEYDVDGGIYLLPYDYSISGIGYNKTLLEEHDIEVPKSFAQLRDETIPALQEAGIEVADCLMNLPGYPFQYFFNVANTKDVNTLAGRSWQEAFIAGEEPAGDFLKGSIDYFQEWIDAGMVNTTRGTDDSGGLLDHFIEGNTAFWLGSIIRFSENEDGSGDQYGLMPYLSEDGSQNIYVTLVSRSYGLNKELEEEGNEQKLEDALHVLEIMSTNEGYEAVMGDVIGNMCSIKDFELPEDSPYKDAVEEINNGYCAPLIYMGWEDYIEPFGEAVRSWINGDTAGMEAVAVLDEEQKKLQENGTVYYAEVTEELDTVQAAQLSGQIFLDAVDTADAALISYNIYQPEVPSNLEDGYGANGRIFAGKMSVEDITIFLPTGWYDTLQTTTLPGKEIKELAKEGCDLRGNGYPYPYVLMTKDGKALEDDTEYTVIFCGIPKDMKDTVTFEDTGIVGLDAAKEYLQKTGEISSATLDDSLVQTVE